jgi:dihydrolipoamide dehydrogenase
VTGLTGGIEFLFKKNKVDYVKGWGKFSGENSVAVDLNDGKKDEVSAKNIIIATGSEPAALPKGMLDIDEQYVVTSTGALDLKEVPGSMIVIGGGVIGLEMGSVYARLGTKVDVIEFADRICPTLDKEVTTQFAKLLKKQGLNIQTSTKLVSGVNNKDKGVELIVENAKGQQKMKADVVLLCVGRRPFTDGLDLAKAGLEANKFGRVEINDHWQTKKPHIYAIGDVVDGPMLAHKAEEEGIAAVEHILGEGGHVNYGAIPGVIYTHPEVANVGLSEEELKEKGIAYSKGVFPFQANSRARTND